MHILEKHPAIGAPVSFVLRGLNGLPPERLRDLPPGLWLVESEDYGVCQHPQTARKDIAACGVPLVGIMRSAWETVDAHHQFAVSHYVTYTKHTISPVVCPMCRKHAQEYGAHAEGILCGSCYMKEQMQ